MTIQAVARAVPPQVADVFEEVKGLTAMERLALAKLLLESVLVAEPSEETEWSAMGLEAFQKDWDNPEDAIYDNWRVHYGIPAR